MCVCVCARLWVVLTLACWHGATPGAIVGAGPCDGVVPYDHHVPQLTGERHILAHCDVVAKSESVCWNTGVATGDHCHWWLKK